MSLFRRLRNWLGDRAGFGHCACCGDTWDWKEEFVVWDSEHGGTFFFCQECVCTKGTATLMWILNNELIRRNEEPARAQRIRTQYANLFFDRDILGDEPTKEYALRR